ncbi:MAG: hypothetical protein CIT03_09810 [Methanobacterium sp.]|nr:MAG: hypothetical protein CIT03_09810 [Methanobacterium sp.]
MKSNHFLVKYQYKNPVDTLYIRIIGNYDYQDSLKLSDDLTVDFDSEKVPISIKLENASQVLEVDKKSLNHISVIRMEIISQPESIEFSGKLVLKIKHEDVEKTFQATADNKLDIPEIKNVFTTTGIY